MNIQILVNGTISGLTLAVLALGFAIVYLPCRVFYLALAGVYALVPYIALACLHNDCPPWLAIIAAVVVGIVVSILCEMINHAPLERRRGSPGAHLIASLGLYLIMVQVVAIIWGNETQVLRSGMDVVYRFGEDLVLTRAQAIAGITSLLLLAGFYCWLQISNHGLQFRAMADNPIQLALHGYNVKRLRLLAFAISGFLGAISALCMANDVGFDPQGGLPVLLLAVVAVIIGGSSSFLAPILGGILLGIVRAVAVWHLSARWQDAVAFVLLATFLLFRPQGILGRKLRAEAAG